jgi:hypothetical protein
VAELKIGTPEKATFVAVGAGAVHAWHRPVYAQS